MLLMALTIRKFKLGPVSFEGELNNLIKEPPALPNERVKEVNEQVKRFSKNTVELDLLLMRLSIEIETTLRNL